MKHIKVIKQRDGSTRILEHEDADMRPGEKLAIGVLVLLMLLIGPVGTTYIASKKPEVFYRKRKPEQIVTEEISHVAMPVLDQVKATTEHKPAHRGLIRRGVNLMAIGCRKFWRWIY